MREDFYAAAYLSYTHKVTEEFQVTQKMRSRNFYSILWIWVSEMTLIVIILQSVVFSKPHFAIVTPNVDVYVTRFLANLLMHMELIGDVK